MPKSRSKRRRYQAPPKPRPKPSPRWLGPAILVVLFGGVIVIVLNYLGFLLETSNFYLFLGLGLIALGFVAATRLR